MSFDSSLKEAGVRRAMRKLGRLLWTFPAMLAACHHQQPADALPPVDVIRMVESKLADQACIKPLQQWARFYRYPAAKDFQQDKSQIDFHFQQAGVDGFKSGIYRRPTERGFIIDDRTYRLVEGVYVISSGEVKVQSCGSNMPSGTSNK